MPKLPVLSGADVIKALERLGFERLRQRGSHVILRREVKLGTLAGVLRQAGVTQDEFLGAVK